MDSSARLQMTDDPSYNSDSVCLGQLPQLCRELLVAYMDARTRRAWRLVNKHCCMDVYDTTLALTWAGKQQPFASRQDGNAHAHAHERHGRSARRRPSSSLRDALFRKCIRLQRLRLHGSGTGTDSGYLHGLPCHLTALELHSCPAATDFSPLSACPGLRDLHVAFQPASTGGTTATPQGPHTRPDSRTWTARLAAILTGHTHAPPLTPPCPTKADLPAALRALPSLHTLSISHLPGSAAALAHAIPHLPHLRRLLLTGVSLTDGGAEALGSALTHAPGLQDLELRLCQLHPGGAAHLLQGIAQGQAHSDSNSNMSTRHAAPCSGEGQARVGRRAEPSRGQAPEPGRALRRLTIAHMVLEGAPLAGVVASLPHLSHLNLTGCHMTWRDAAALAPVLPQLKHLDSMVFESNIVTGTRGAEALAQAFATMPRLNRLKLESICMEGRVPVAPL